MHSLSTLLSCGSANILLSSTSSLEHVLQVKSIPVTWACAIQSFVVYGERWWALHRVRESMSRGREREGWPHTQCISASTSSAL